MTVLHDTIKDDVLNELEQFETTGDTVVTYYRDLEFLDRLVMDAIVKVDKFLSKYDSWELYSYLAKPDTSKSTELIKNWDVDYSATVSPLECLSLMMEDNLPYMTLVAC